MRRIGVLALQGGFAAHASALRALGHEAVEVRCAHELAAIDGLVLPGGESTTQLKLIDRGGLAPALCELVEQGKPVLATCAGVILAARRVLPSAQRSFGWIDITVHRNAYGRQLDSFEAESDAALPLVFIRAPRIEAIGAGVEVLDRFRGEPIMVRQGNVVGACFHPELTTSTAVHRLVFGDGGQAVAGAGKRTETASRKPLRPMASSAHICVANERTDSELIAKGA